MSHMMRIYDPIFGRVWTALALATLTGCTSFTGMDDRGASVQRYFGYLEVTQPPLVNMPPNAEVEGVRVYGIKVEQGFTLGYSDTNVVRVPIDCRAVILVKTQEQLDQVKQLLNGKESDICGAVTPD